jgi:hypothetical protein
MVPLATPNVGGEAGPTAEGQAREAQHGTAASRGPGLPPLGLASTDGLGVAFGGETMVGSLTALDVTRLDGYGTAC